MPPRETYICDKTVGLKGEHRECKKEVGAGGLALVLTVSPLQESLPTEDEPGELHVLADLKFCSQRCAQYWLIRQRLS